MFDFFKKHFSKKKPTGYYFIHIPKTAGTSFINILDTCVAQEKIFPCQLWQEINPEVVSKKSNYQLLRGHFGGGAYKLLTNGNPHLLTILRHPQSLSVSTYHFIKREKNTAVHDLVTSRDMSLLEFLQEPLTATKINNRMVRHLSFDLQSDPQAQELFLSEQSIKVVSNWIKTPKNITNQQRLQRAKKIIDDCSWFGIQEQFDKSLQLFAYQFNLPPLGKTAKLNSHLPKQHIDAQCVSLIEQQNSYDLELYEYAFKEFEKQYQEMCESLNCKEENLDEFLEKNYFSHQNKKSSKIDFKFEQQLSGSGWHRREIAMPEKSYFRWTHNSNATLYFNLTSQDYILQVRIINAVSEQHLDKLQLVINNEKTTYSYDVDGGVVRVLTAAISKKMVTHNPLKIEFKQLQTEKHSDCFASDDQRRLGIAVNWIKISACQMKQ